MHDDIYISADVQRITLNASCITISGGRTEQLDIACYFCHVAGFTSDFLISVIVVEHYRFFYGAIQLLCHVFVSVSRILKLAGSTR